MVQSRSSCGQSVVPVARTRAILCELLRNLLLLVVVVLICLVLFPLLRFPHRRPFFNTPLLLSPPRMVVSAWTPLHFAAGWQPRPPSTLSHPLLRSSYPNTVTEPGHGFLSCFSECRCAVRYILISYRHETQTRLSLNLVISCISLGAGPVRYNCSPSLYRFQLCASPLCLLALASALWRSCTCSLYTR